MASSILGGETPATPPPGHDNRALGPSDTSDSGSDVAGIENDQGRDPAVPTDVAMDPDAERTDPSFEDFGVGADSDAGGTGERSTAAGDAAPTDAPDISPDKVIDAEDDLEALDTLDSATADDAESAGDLDVDLNADESGDVDDEIGAEGYAEGRRGTSSSSSDDVEAAEENPVIEGGKGVRRTGDGA